MANISSINIMPSGHATCPEKKREGEGLLYCTEDRISY
jgi:hypothetical protein